MDLLDVENDIVRDGVSTEGRALPCQEYIQRCVDEYGRLRVIPYPVRVYLAYRLWMVSTPTSIPEQDVEADVHFWRS